MCKSTSERFGQQELHKNLKWCTKLVSVITTVLFIFILLLLVIKGGNIKAVAKLLYEPLSWITILKCIPKLHVQ